MTALIAPRSHDIGGLEVRRAVPSLQARSVGPFVFVDHMGPALFEPGCGIDVHPHPHIGLATVTYLWPVRCAIATPWAACRTSCPATSTG